MDTEQQKRENVLEVKSRINVEITVIQKITSCHDLVVFVSNDAHQSEERSNDSLACLLLRCRMNSLTSSEFEKNLSKSLTKDTATECVNIE
jgi:hypothetical protein